MFEIIFGSMVAASLIATYVTNPFARFTIVRLPYRLKIEKDTLHAVDKNSKLTVRNNWFWKLFAIYQCGIYILTTRYFHSPSSDGESVDAIIADIHRLRYDPNKLLLISGDHFNGLFVRNLGVFYYPMVDTMIKSSEQDWYDRQSVYIQTVAFALGVYEKDPRLTTTIVSMGPLSATCVNFYAYPSDTLFGILYALASLSDIEKSRPFNYGKEYQTLDTIPSAKKLATEYKDTLVALYNEYTKTVYDTSSGLVSKKVHLSGAKDITRRESAFYDNVVYWKTSELAMKIGIIPNDKRYLQSLKKRIIKTFWLEDKGYFLEDLSEESQKKSYYSSDWLIVLSTRFLDPENPDESKYFIRSVNYIQKENIDKPFAIKYQQDTRAHRQFLPVRLAVASYGGDAIWSFWGMEYIKTLILLYAHTRQERYAQTANYHLDKYTHAMIENKGFPEVYDANGRLLQTPLYRSIRQTGWVIGFEQARAMYRSLVDSTYDSSGSPN